MAAPKEKGKFIYLKYLEIKNLQTCTVVVLYIKTVKTTYYFNLYKLLNS